MDLHSLNFTLSHGFGKCVKSLKKSSRLDHLKCPEGSNRSDFLIRCLDFEWETAGFENSIVSWHGWLSYEWV